MQAIIERLAERPEPFARGDVGLWADPRARPRLRAEWRSGSETLAAVARG